MLIVVHGLNGKPGTRSHKITAADHCHVEDAPNQILVMETSCFGS